MRGDSELRVSAIIPARDEETTIARCVRSVASQGGVREMILTDDNTQAAQNFRLGRLYRSSSRLFSPGAAKIAAQPVIKQREGGKDRWFI
jgi:glycosyltransferase involved in cell wall biosynthesis